VKFYKRFPGDITIKTGDLTLVEFGAYDRLLDHYYAKEQPIDPGRIYIVTRCQTAADRNAVDRVLAEYWKLTDAGWVQERADEMIAEALPKIEAARENGKKGGRPVGSGKKPTGLFSETKSETETPDSEKASQSQNKKEKVSKASPSHPPAGGKAAQFDDFWLAWPKNERKQDKAKCLDHWKRHGLDDIAETILADVRTKRGTTKWGEGFIEAPLVYLRGKRWEDGVTPNEGSPAAAVANWWDSTAGIIAKGVQLECGEWSEEIWMRTGVQWPTYRANVFAAAGSGPWSEPPRAGLPGVIKTLEPA
jgi:uncharacterized protein YdaU (DUF1376 family)